MIFKKLLKNRAETSDIPPVPSWDRIVAALYDKQLDSFCDEVIKVIYSKDRAMRYVVLKSEKGFLTYQLEAIYQFDRDEWKYICINNDALPAMWEPFRGIEGKSVFSCIDDLEREMKAEPEYKRYFE